MSRGKLVLFCDKEDTQIYIYIWSEREERERERLGNPKSGTLQNVWRLVPKSAWFEVKSINTIKFHPCFM